MYCSGTSAGSMPRRPEAGEPIAIVGSSCRFAGGVTSPSKLWNILATPHDLSKEVPASRFNIQGFYHPDAEHPGTTNSPKGYWLEQDHRVFDCAFFNITPKEAEAIDPQQRILLEVVFEALESAGYTLQQYAGQDVAVYAGVMTADYDTLSQRDDLTTSQYYATGNARSIISNRLSYFFNFHGPSMTIDTACSSSLVALHQAVLSLRARESVMACVTGVNLMLTPEQFIVESNLHMLSPSGHCRMWDARADGYARGEGAAALFLKRLGQAIADGDTIQGIVRETGVNSDGRTKGLTLPNPAAQTALITATYQRAGLDPGNPNDRCQYFEAHGTGTPAGDPREAEAISKAFFGVHHNENAPSRKLYVGSVKTVIGHTEGAAGLAGILKVVQAMRRHAIPPNLHLETLNTSVAPFCTNLHVPTHLEPWPEVPDGQPLRASVNSFGFGGTNSHAIVEHYDPAIHNKLLPGRSPLQAATSSTESSDIRVGADGTSITLPLLLSANSQQSLVDMARLYKACLLENGGSMSLQTLCWHLASTRTILPFRLAVCGESRSDMIQQLGSCLQSVSSASDACPSGRLRARADRRPRLLGVFTGQGAQWPKMSRGLLQTSTLFRQSIRRLDGILQTCLDPPPWTLEQEIQAEHSTSRVHTAAVAQPLCTAIQISLVDLLKTVGVVFTCVVGHSSGEIAAAYAAGRLTARDAILIAYYRGLHAHLSRGRDGQEGRMIATGINMCEATRLCHSDPFRDRICIAANNGPCSVTLSGDKDAIQDVHQRLLDRGKFSRLLVVDAAYHSHHMEEPAKAYFDSLAHCKITPLKPRGSVIWISSVNEDGGSPHCDELRARYWIDNMVRPVLFHEALQKAMVSVEPLDAVIEVGPHPALAGPVARIAREILPRPLPYSSLLGRRKHDGLAFSEFLGFMWMRFGSSSVDIRRFVETSSQPHLVKSRLDDMPSYPWDHSQIHHRESRISRQYHLRTRPPHELLGVRTRDDTEFELRWRNVLRLDVIPWLEHHKFQGQALLPASAYCIMALDAARVLLGARSASLIELQDLEFHCGITVEPDSQGVETLFSLGVETPPEHQASSKTSATFALTSAPADGSLPMRRNFTGRLRITLGQQNSESLPTCQTRQAETLPIRPDSFYDMMAELGLDYTGPFRALRKVDRRFNFASTRLKKRHPHDSTRSSLSPATLDACLQSCFATFSSPGDRALWTPFLPKKMRRVRFNMAVCDELVRNHELLVQARLTDFHPVSKVAAADITGDVSVFNQQGEMEVQVEGLTVGSFASASADDDKELYLHTVYDLDPDDEIILPTRTDDAALERVLVESCKRVASFHLRGQPERSPSPTSALITSPPRGDSLATTNHWTQETRSSLEEFIASSPFYSTLELIRTLGENLSDVLPGMLPTIIHEAKQLSFFQRHLVRVMKQISHRYPRMNILELTDPHLGLSDPILAGLGSSFQSYVIGEEDEQDSSSTSPRQRLRQRHKITTQKLDLWKDLDSQLSSPTKFDVVILSASLARRHSTMRLLKLVNRTMRPGGFLLLIHVSVSPLRDRLTRCAAFRHNVAESLTPPEWPDLLDACGFTQTARNADQYYPPGFCLTVRQSESHQKRLIHSPLRGNLHPRGLDRVIIIGGKADRVSRLTSDLRDQLAPVCRSITVVQSLEKAGKCSLDTFTSAVLLADLSDPILSLMSSERLNALRGLMRPEMVVLWVTQQARAENPDHAASFGFARTMLAEIPALRLQMLDLDSLQGASTIIAESLTRRAIEASMDGTDPESEDFLWTHEPEIHSESSRRLIPRVVPYQTANDRVNSHRRVITYPVNTLESFLEIIPPDSGCSMYKTAVGAIDTSDQAPPGQVAIQVHYSSTETIRTGRHCHPYLCVGHDLHSGSTVASLASRNASFIQVPSSSVVRLEQSFSTRPGFVNMLLVALVCISIAESCSSKTIYLVEPDEMLLDCVKATLAARGVAIRVYTTTAQTSRKDPGCIFLHPYLTTRELKALFPPAAADVFNFLPEKTELSKFIREELPPQCRYHSREELLGSHAANVGTKEAERNGFILEQAVELARKCSSKHKTWESSALISVPTLLQSSDRCSPFEVIDWRADRLVEHTLDPKSFQGMLRPDRTYVLVGLTRDMGHSLCRLFADQGARNIVLASRNPNKSPLWKDELASLGVNITIESLDVTSRQSVLAFKQYINTKMPPVGGVVNGAMVLEDRVFAQMTVETLEKVMRPKTIGSKNLDVAFDGADVDFFIMTSSFAAIGGHAGQSNYAAANMYMNGLAANRRSRGLAGSVLNIGVVYGLGFIHREKDNLYQGLEREGYPPISERDLHHMFLEAIVAGRPVPGQIADLTTGLSRYRYGAETLHWQRDPRFGHFTIGDSGDGGDNGESKIARRKEECLWALLESAATAEERASVLVEAFSRRLERILHSMTGSISGESCFSELGVDSLVAVEIRNWIWKSFEQDVPVMKILSSVSVAQLCNEIAGLHVIERKIALSQQNLQVQASKCASRSTPERDSDTSKSVESDDFTHD